MVSETTKNYLIMILSVIIFILAFFHTSKSIGDGSSVRSLYQAPK